MGLPSLLGAVRFGTELPDKVMGEANARLVPRPNFQALLTDQRESVRAEDTRGYTPVHCRNVRKVDKSRAILAHLLLLSARQRGVFERFGPGRCGGAELGLPIHAAPPHARVVLKLLFDKRDGRLLS
jgi:hypothetical protein